MTLKIYFEKHIFENCIKIKDWLIDKSQVNPIQDRMNETKVLNKFFMLCEIEKLLLEIFPDFIGQV